MRKFAGVGAGMLILCLLLVGCGERAGQQVSAATAPVATSMPMSSPTFPPTVNPSQLPKACAPDPQSIQTYYQIGDIIVSSVTFGLDYPAAQLPDGTALKPFKLPNQNGTLPGSPPVNPEMKESPSGFAFSVCNGSASKSHLLQSIGVNIAAFQAYTGELNSWEFCDGNYTRQNGVQQGGCGGGYAAQQYLHATFAPSDTTGASAVVAQTGTGPLPPSAQNMAPLPVSLAPGEEISMNVGLTTPTVAGVYTFGFTIGLDGATPTLFSNTTPALFAPIAHKWTGAACMAPSMQSQIPPATTPPTYYICPVS